MKTVLVFTVALFSLGLASAKDIKFPEEAPALFTITIPDSWSPEYADDGTLEAEHEDEHSYLAIWEEETSTELQKVAEDIDEILNEYATDVKLTTKKPYSLNGMSGLVFQGTAKDKEDGSGIGFEALVLAVTETRAVIIYFDYSQDAPEEVVKRLVKILESVKPAKAP